MHRVASEVEVLPDDTFDSPISEETSRLSSLQLAISIAKCQTTYLFIYVEYFSRRFVQICAWTVGFFRCAEINNFASLTEHEIPTYLTLILTLILAQIFLVKVKVEWLYFNLILVKVKFKVNYRVLTLIIFS